MTAADAWSLVLAVLLVAPVLGVAIARGEERRERLPAERLLDGPHRRRK